MTTTTVFASTADGDINSTHATYSTARAGGTLTTPVSAATELWVGQLLLGNFACYESFVSFDTSAIPDNDIIRSVTLDLWLVTDSSATDFTVRAASFDWGATLTTADWVAGASLAGLTEVASLPTSGIGATGAYKTFTSDPAFLTVAGIKTGTVRLVLFSSRHAGNNQPGGAEFLTFSSADVASTTQDPRLTIVHDPGAQPPYQQPTPNRIWRVR